jgi:hypothetical protein
LRHFESALHSNEKTMLRITRFRTRPVHDREALIGIRHALCDAFCYAGGLFPPGDDAAESLLTYYYSCIWRCYVRARWPGRPIKKETAISDGILEAVKTAVMPLTVPEIRKRLWQLVWRIPPPLAFIIAWSLWRRRDQAVAMIWHYRRRTTLT